VVGASEPCPTAIVDVAGVAVAEAATGAGAADCSDSFGADAQAEKTAKVEREIIETQLKIRALFKFVLLLIDLQGCWGEPLCYLKSPLPAPFPKFINAAHFLQS